MPQPIPLVASGDSHNRLPAEERRRQLIEVAIDLFSRRGFSGTTTKEIAASAGVTEAIIFRHFATKHQLYTAILDYRFRPQDGEMWIAAMDRSMAANDDEAVFRYLLSSIIQSVREDAKFERVMLYAALEGHELAAMYHQQLAIPVLSLLREYVTRRQSEGALAGFNSNAIIYAVAGMAKQYATYAHMCAYDIGFSDEQAIETFTRILMNGVCARATERSTS